MLKLPQPFHRVIQGFVLLSSIGLLLQSCENSQTSSSPIAEKPAAEKSKTAEKPAAEKPAAEKTKAAAPEPKAAAPKATEAKTTEAKTTESASKPVTPKAKARGEVSCPKATPVAYFETKSRMISICMGQDNKLFYREISVSGPPEGRNLPNATEQGEGNFVAGFEGKRYQVNAKSLKVIQNSSLLFQEPVTHHKIMSTTNTL